MLNRDIAWRLFQEFEFQREIPSIEFDEEKRSSWKFLFTSWTLTPKLFPSSILGIISWIQSLMMATSNQRTKIRSSNDKTGFLHCRGSERWTAWFGLRVSREESSTERDRWNCSNCFPRSSRLFVFSTDSLRCYSTRPNNKKEQGDR